MLCAIYAVILRLDMPLEVFEVLSLFKLSWILWGLNNDKYGEGVDCFPR